MRHLVLIFVITLFLLNPISKVFAQSLEIEPSINLNIDPIDPAPGDLVTASLTSYEINLGLTYISWKYNNIETGGYGKTDLPIKLNSAENKTEVITAVITLDNGQKVQKTITISPQTIDMTWEALNTKVPPFYPGKRIPIKENQIRTIVLNSDSNPKVATYSWLKNGSNIVNKNGSTNPYIDFTNNEAITKEKITVNVKSKNNESSKTIEIPFTKPRIMFYEHNPLFGLNLGNVIDGNISSYENIVSVFMVPIGFNKNMKPLISWVLSGQEVENQTNQYLLAFNKPNENGRVTVEVNVENTKTFYQEVKGFLELFF